MWEGPWARIRTQEGSAIIHNGHGGEDWQVSSYFTHRVKVLQTGRHSGMVV